MTSTRVMLLKLNVDKQFPKLYVVTTHLHFRLNGQLTLPKFSNRRAAQPSPA